MRTLALLLAWSFSCAACAGDPCESTALCRMAGLCTLTQGVCRAGDDAECAASELCLDRGCVRRNGFCRLEDDPADTEAMCQKAGSIDGEYSRCQDHGACAVVDGMCAPTTEGHCRASRACKERGLCELRGNVCVWPDQAACERSPACAEEDQCTFFHHFCVATPIDCATSKRCDPETGDGCMVDGTYCTRKKAEFIYFQF